LLNHSLESVTHFLRKRSGVNFFTLQIFVKFTNCSSLVAKLTGDVIGYIGHSVTVTGTQTLDTRTLA